MFNKLSGMHGQTNCPVILAVPQQIENHPKNLRRILDCQVEEEPCLSWQCAHDRECGDIQGDSGARCQLGLVDLCAAAHYISWPTACLYNDCKQHKLLIGPLTFPSIAGKALSIPIME